MKFIALNDEIGNEIFVNADRIVTMRDRFGKTELYLSTDKQITVIESVSEILEAISKSYMKKED